MSGEYFEGSIYAFGDYDSGKVHAYMKLTSLETGKTIYVDDGFTGVGSFIHMKPPIGGIYKSPFSFEAEMDRKNCDVPPFYGNNGMKWGKLEIEIGRFGEDPASTFFQP